MDVRSMRNAVLGARVVNALKSRNIGCILCRDKGRGSRKSSGADAEGKYDQLGRNDERGRSRTDGCHSKRRLHVI